nr:hypothetical protein [Tanacetum cinerariifolium]
MSKPKKVDQLPYPRFTKLITYHIQSQNGKSCKRSNSMMHRTTKDEVLSKLTFMSKGEPKGALSYGVKILDAMLSDTIKESDDYINYLTKYKSAQPSVPTLGRACRKVYISRGGIEINVGKKRKAKVLRKKQTITVADNILEDPD